MRFYKVKLEKIIPGGALNYLRRFRIRRYGEELFTPQQFSSPNTDSVPHLSANAILENMGEKQESWFVRSFKDFVEKVSTEGEWRSYSTSDGATAAAEIHIKADGTVLARSNEGDSSVEIRPNGDIEVSASNNIEALAEGNIDVLAGQDATIKSTSGGSSVVVKSDGSIELNGSVYAGLVDIIRLTATLNTMITLYNTHTHNVTAPFDLTPDIPYKQPILTKDLYENLTVKHGVG